LFTPKRRELVAKYFSDLSKLFFAASAVKQFVDVAWSPRLFFGGMMITLALLSIGFFAHPKE
jgi:hypothetical protein